MLITPLTDLEFKENDYMTISRTISNSLFLHAMYLVEDFPHSPILAHCLNININYNLVFIFKFDLGMNGYIYIYVYCEKNI